MLRNHSMSIDRQSLTKFLKSEVDRQQWKFSKIVSCPTAATRGPTSLYLQPLPLTLFFFTLVK